MSTETLILTHRGLEPTQPNFFSESSLEAFTNHLKRGFGIEFDFNRTLDNEVVIFHDITLTRITHGRDVRAIIDVPAEELRTTSLPNGTICFIDQLAPLLKKSPAGLHALHVKGNHQSPADIELLISIFKHDPVLMQNVALFDLRLEVAQQLKSTLPDIQLGLSIAHPYDIERYNAAVHHTLYSVEIALLHRDIFSLAWLDEWDTTHSDGHRKHLYTSTTFEILKASDFRVAVVSPELHATSPHLLGGESHPDAVDRPTLFRRIEEILSLNPDFICTDYPVEVSQLITHSS